MQNKIIHIWHRFLGISTWALLAVFVVFTVTSIVALRQNNLQMVKLRSAVYAADANNTDIELALRNLRTFVYGHMNTNLRAGSTSSEAPIQLTNQFSRIVAAEQAKLATKGNANLVFAQAQAQCSATPLTERPQCIQEYVIQNGGNYFELNLPAKELYTFDFVSPKWSPDLAGWAIVGAVTSGILLVLNLLGKVISKRYRS